MNKMLNFLLLKILLWTLITFKLAISNQHYSNTLKKFHNQQILEKIIAETSFSHINTNLINQQNIDFRKNVFLFIDKVTNIGRRNSCDTRLIQSDVQAKMRNLKSIISTCNGYCRIAMNQDGHIYGAKDFSLDTIWKRVDVNDDLIEKNKAYLGAFYLKFILSDKYLCINQNGELFSSVGESKGCLWFNPISRLISASYNLNLVIQNNCKLNVQENTNLNDDEALNSNNNNNNKNHKLFLRKKVFNQILNTENTCKNHINITSGYSPDLQKFFHTCQSNLLKQQNPNENNIHIPTTKSSTLKPIFMHSKSFKTNSLIFFTTKTTTAKTTTTTKSAFITKKTFSDDPNQINLLLFFNKNLIEKAKLLCKDYLLDEMIFKKLNYYEYLYESSKSIIESESVYKINNNKNNNNNYFKQNFLVNKNNIPKLCIDYLFYLNQTSTNESKKQQIDSNEYFLNSEESVLNDKLTNNLDINNNNNDNNKFKKCYSLRHTPMYKQCMDKYYKCHKFNNNVEKLKNCRKKYGITVPKKKPISYDLSK